MSTVLLSLLYLIYCTSYIQTHISCIRSTWQNMRDVVLEIHTCCIKIHIYAMLNIYSMLNNIYAILNTCDQPGGRF